MSSASFQLDNTFCGLRSAAVERLLRDTGYLFCPGLNPELLQHKRAQQASQPERK